MLSCKPNCPCPFFYFIPEFCDSLFLRFIFIVIIASVVYHSIMKVLNNMLMFCMHLTVLLLS